MIAILVFILMLILLDLIAVRRGVDSTDGINSCEWERRQHSNSICIEHSHLESRAGASPARTLDEARHRQRTRAGASPARTLDELAIRFV